MSAPRTTLGALLALATLAACGRDEPPRRPPPPAPKGGMADMPGMPGMPMGGGSDSAVRLTPGQLREFGVTFARAEERELAGSVRAAGVVTVDERRLTAVVPRAGGFVERLLVEATGQQVRRGQTLAALYSPDVLAAEEELLVAARLAGAMGTAVPGVPAPPADLLAAARRRLALLGASDAEIDAVLRAGRAQRTIALRAPASGVVLEKRVVEGQAVAAGEALYTIADLGAVWVEAALREADAAAARVGAGADVELPAEPGRVYKGTIALLAPALDPATRTLRARVAVTNGGGRLRPGMSATVRLAGAPRRALTVPASALVRTGERTLVFVDAGGGRLTPREVRAGQVAGEVAEIVSGLKAGERVVTSAQYLLESESNLADVMRSMIGQGMGGQP